MRVRLVAKMDERGETQAAIDRLGRLDARIEGILAQIKRLEGLDAMQGMPHKSSVCG